MKSESPEKNIHISSVIVTVLAAVSFLIALHSPLWKVDLYSHNYPQGLQLIAYGDRLDGDLHELNIINHYVGMQHINPDEIEMMKLFPYAIGGCILLTFLTLLFRKYKKIVSYFLFLFPLGILCVIQYYLYQFGNHLSSEAPFRMKPFTPLVLGISKIMNFKADAMIQYGFVLILAGILLIGFGETWIKKGMNFLNRNKKIAVTVSVFILLGFLPFILNAESIQERINNAKPHDTIRIEKGIYKGFIIVSKPICLTGIGQPVIDGMQNGSVILIKSDSVVISGFKIINSGKGIMDESAGIKIEGNYIEIKNNEITNVFFGISVLGGSHVLIEKNYLHPGENYAERAGHVINIWNCTDSKIFNNTISSGRDGIFLTYNKNVVIRNNEVTKCRYALHSMYSEQMIFSQNKVYENLLGCALMYSKNLTAENNQITWQRKGSSPYGFLLKDIENLEMRENLIAANSIGIYAEGVSQKTGTSSIIENNQIEGNDCALAFHSTVKLLFFGNEITDNLSDIRKLGQHISSDIEWIKNGRGNFWSNYRGYDLNNDNIGELPFQVNSVKNFSGDPRNPFRMFLHTPSYEILESMTKMFPLLESGILMEDDFPVLSEKVNKTENVMTAEMLPVIFISTILSGGVFLFAAKFTERNWI